MHITAVSTVTLHCEKIWVTHHCDVNSFSRDAESRSRLSHSWSNEYMRLVWGIKQHACTNSNIKLARVSGFVNPA